MTPAPSIRDLHTHYVLIFDLHVGLVVDGSSAKIQARLLVSFFIALPKGLKAESGWCPDFQPFPWKPQLKKALFLAERLNRARCDRGLMATVLKALVVLWSAYPANCAIHKTKHVILRAFGRHSSSWSPQIWW